MYRQDWGEQMVGKHSSVLCVLDVESGVPSVLENTPDNVSPGQVNLNTHGFTLCRENIIFY